MSTQDYLFELGCEELPPTELPKLAESLRQNLSAGLEKSRLRAGFPLATPELRAETIARHAKAEANQ